MAMRQTSIDAYESIREELSSKQFIVMKAIKDLGMASNRMVAKHLDWEINRVTGRVTELVNKGFITDNGTFVDKETNRTVTLWKYDG